MNTEQDIINDSKELQGAYPKIYEQIERYLPSGKYHLDLYEGNRNLIVVEHDFLIYTKDFEYITYLPFNKILKIEKKCSRHIQVNILEIKIFDICNNIIKFESITEDDKSSLLERRIINLTNMYNDKYNKLTYVFDELLSKIK